MSRSGYTDSCEGWELIRWRGAVESALRGQRGQAFLREMIVALDAIPEKSLVEGSLEAEGEVCAMGAVGQKRGIDMTKVDPKDRHQVADAFGISPAMAAEIAYQNDEGNWRETPVERWTRMRAWTAKQLRGRGGIMDAETLRSALEETLECIDEFIDVLDNEWKDGTPLKVKRDEWRAALAAPESVRLLTAEDVKASYIPLTCDDNADYDLMAERLNRRLREPGGEPTR